jgi:hypothetical protein
MIPPYLEMPPVTRYVEHAGFSWAWFCFFAIADLLLIAACCGPLLRATAKTGSN